MPRRTQLWLVLTATAATAGFRATGPSLRPGAVHRASVRLIADKMPSTEDALLLENAELREKVAMLEDTIERTEGLCEVLDTGGWADSLQPRATWLLGLLVAQSCSSFILQDNEALLQSHPTVIFFMTMLVGAGGNAGNQASVRLIRGLATGEVDPKSGTQTRRILLNEARVAPATSGREPSPRQHAPRPGAAERAARLLAAPAQARVGLSLALILVVAGWIRVVAFQASPVDAAAISASLFLIVTSSVLLGTVRPQPR